MFKMILFKQKKITECYGLVKANGMYVRNSQQCIFGQNVLYLVVSPVRLF